MATQTGKKFMRKRWLIPAFFCVLGVLGASCSGDSKKAQQVGEREQLRSKVESTFKPLVEQDGEGPYGAYEQIAIGVITGDEVDFYGFSSKDASTKPTMDTLFELGASTQVFTALSYAQQVSAGKLGIYDKAADVLKDSKIPSHEDGQIRIEQLASHFSQLPWLPTNMGVMGSLTLNPFKNYTSDKFDAFLSDYKLKSVPGRDYQYSLTGMGLLAKVLGNVTGKPLAELQEESIFDPLQMKDTRYTLTDDQQARMAQGYFNGIAVKPWDYNALTGAGGLKSSVGDLVRFVKAQMYPDDSALGKAIAMSQEPRGHYPLGTMAMGWQIAGRNIEYYYWTAGYTSGSQSYIAFVPDREDKNPARRRTPKGIIVLSNSVFNSPNDAKAFWLRIHILAKHVMDEVTGRPTTE